MAETYYNYAERSADSQINWAQVGKDITDMISTEKKIREEKRDAIDKASREFGKQLADSPKGQNSYINQWTGAFADDAQQARLLQDRLLKSGQLKLKDYTIMRQNITDGTEQAFNLAKDYQATYAEKMQRWKEDKTSLATIQMAQMAESFAKFGDTKLLINPTDFSLSIGKMIAGPNGVKILDKNQNEHMPVSTLKNIIVGDIDKFDLEGSAKSIVDSLGNVINANAQKMGSLGLLIESISSPALHKKELEKAGIDVEDFNKTLDSYAVSMVGNDLNKLSTMVDYMKFDPKTKQQYQVTFNPDDLKKGSNYILVDKTTLQPSFTAEQEKAVHQFAKNRLVSKIGESEKLDYSNRTQYQPERFDPYKADYETKIKESKHLADLFAKNFGGTDQEVSDSRAGLELLGVKTDRIVDKKTGKVTIGVQDENGDIVPIPTSKEAYNSFARAVASKAKALGYNADAVYDEMIKLNPKKLNTSKGYQQQAATADIDAAVSDALGKVTKNYSTEEQSTIVSDLAPILKPLGVTVKKVGTGGRDVVRIVLPNGAKFADGKTYVEIEADTGGISGAVTGLFTDTTTAATSKLKNALNELPSILKGLKQQPQEGGTSSGTIDASGY